MKIEAHNTSERGTRIGEDEVRLELARIVRSKYFAHAPKKQKFLQCISEYYLQGRATNLNEYLIGCEVFDKGEKYHPSADPVVRVAAHDVRKKLEMYYQNEGCQDPIRMTIPVGTYVPVFSRLDLNVIPPTDTTTELALDPDIQPVTNPASREASPSTRRILAIVSADLTALVLRRLEKYWRPTLIIVTIVAALGILAGTWLLVQNRNLRQQLAMVNIPDPSWQPLRQGIYAPFLNNQSSTYLILSNPVVYRTVNGADPEVLSKKGIDLTADQANSLSDYSGFRLPMRANHPMQLIPAFNSYTGIGEAVGVYRLHGLLQAIGEPSTLKQSRNVGADDLKEHDIILLGSVYANQWAKPLSIKENFVYTDRTTIENLAPMGAEPREFISVFDQRTGALLEDYALITVAPGVAETNVVMSLSGIYSEGTQAAVEFVTDKHRLAELQQRLTESTGNKSTPQFFQALLKVRVENSFPTQTTLLQVRELKKAS